MPKRALITGITGYVGLGVAKQLINEGFEVIGLVRNNNKDFKERIETLRMDLGETEILQFICCDLEDNQSLSNKNLDGITHIIHTAAVTRFNVEQELAHAINVEGSRKIFELARSCPDLECLSYISTIYTCGLAEGDILETHHQPKAFANHYENSKFDAETLLQSEYGKLPWQILRVATIIADNEQGIVTQQNAFHNTLKLFFYGLLSLAPGEKNAPLYFVTGQFVIDAITELSQKYNAQSIYHICHSQNETSTLGELLDLAYDRFNEEEDFRARNILKPILCDSESFNLLAGETEKMGATVMSQGLGSISPFAKQLFTIKDIKNDKLRNILKNYSAPDPKKLLNSVCSHLLETRWGKRAT